MAICMKQGQAHIHGWCSPPPAGRGHCLVECDQEAMRKGQGRSTTQIGLRVCDKDALKLRMLAARYDSLNAYLSFLIKSQATRIR